MRSLIAAALAAALWTTASAPARAWGAEGHRLINAAAAATLPVTVPAFVRSADAAAEIALLGREADLQRGDGRPRDADDDPAHFLDLDDDGTIGGVPLAALPQSREAYDSALRAGRGLQGKPVNQYAVGYLPYEIADGWEQIAKDFAIWRVERYAEEHATNTDARAFFATARRLREALTLRDIGFWGHFVADGSQPLHVSVHFNGWGPYPNPHGYSTSNKLHAKFETEFVNALALRPAALAADVAPYEPGVGPILPRVSAYLERTGSYVVPLYEFEAKGAFDARTPEAVAFTVERLAAGAQKMRDWIADAFVAAADLKVGYPGATVRDVESGKVSFTPATFGD